MIATSKENIPLLTIGQMIECLFEPWNGDLCDTLWEAVKEWLKTAGRL